MELEFSQQNFEKYLDIKFHESLSGGSRVVPCGQTDMTTLRVTCRNFAKAPDSSLPKGRQAFGFYSGDGVYCEERTGLL